MRTLNAAEEVVVTMRWCDIDTLQATRHKIGRETEYEQEIKAETGRFVRKGNDDRYSGRKEIEAPRDIMGKIETEIVKALVVDNNSPKIQKHTQYLPAKKLRRNTDNRPRRAAPPPTRPHQGWYK